MNCTGMCCAQFHIEDSALLAIMHGTELDDQIIRSMLIPLGDGANFTCRHWDPETRLCNIYESRPQMCRDFPDEDYPCENPGCNT